MKIETISVGPFEVNCYVAQPDRGTECLIVDPGADAPAIEEFLSHNRLSVAAYLLTHGHADHVGALADLYERHPAPVAMHGEDADWAFDAVNQFPPYYAVPRKPVAIARLPKDGQAFTDAGLRYAVIATPGHSPGGVCFHFPDEKVLFAGDTLFQNSVGRTDLPGGNPRTLSKSLARLAALLDDTRVYPGHGPSTTIGAEKRDNFFMRKGARL